MSKVDLAKLIQQLRATQAWQHKYEIAIPVSYTHLTLPTILLV